MSDKKPLLSELLQNVEAGLGKLSSKKERRDPEINESTSDEAPAHDRQESERTASLNDHPGQSPESDLIDDFGEADSGPAKSQSIGERLSALSLKQKALLGAVVLVAVFAAKNQLESTDQPMADSSAEALVASEADPLSGELSEAENAALNAEFKPSTDVDDSTGLDDSNATANDLKLNLDLDDGLAMSPGVSADQSVNPLASFSSDAAYAEVAPTPTEAAPATQNAPAPAPVETADDLIQAESPFAAQPAIAEASAPAQSTQQEASPFADKEQPVFGEATLGGSENTTVDSSNPLPVAPVSAESDTKLAELETLIKSQAGKIKELEFALKNSQQVKPAVQQHQASARQSAPVQVRNIRPTQSIRPKLCVKAVAQAARNCSTCVAHAFVVHNGAETMVGHGDKINDFRVAIVGDRLDLQGADGTEPHKFWSSPNGCTY
jgi:hypothetical protein